LRALEEALAHVDETGERYFLPEVWRLKGEVAALHSAEDAEACFQRALDEATRLGARGWQLRAALSLTRIQRDEARREHAREGLRSIFATFTEGFDTPDLQRAAALLAHAQ